MDLSEIKKKLKNKDIAVKKEALIFLKTAAKEGRDISNALDDLSIILALKNEILWRLAAEIINFHHSNFISFYCRNFGNFLNTIKNLYSSKQKERTEAARYLRTFTTYRESDGRKWNYMDGEKIDQLIIQLQSSEVKERINGAKNLALASKNNSEITKAIPSLTNHLTDENEKVRWACADALGYYIGYYMGANYEYASERLKKGTIDERAKYAGLLASTTLYDMVTDRDERDISFSIPSLTVMLFEKNAKLQNSAMEALRCAQGEHNLEMVIPAMIEILKDGDKKNLHKNASQILQHTIKEGLNASWYIPDLIYIINQNPRGDLRKEIVLILRSAVIKGYKLGNDIKLLMEFLNDEMQEVKFGATDTLAYFFVLNKNWDALERLMEHKDKDVRQEAAGTIEQIPSNIDINPILPKLKNLLKDEIRDVRFVAARTIMAKYKDINSIIAAMPILIEATSNEGELIQKNAFYSITSWMNNNIKCNSEIPQSEWDKIEPLIPILQKICKHKKHRKRAAESLAQYYIHTNCFKEVEKLLKSGTNEVKRHVMYKLTSCGWSSTCNIDTSPLIPTLLDLHFKCKNKEVQDTALRKIEEIVKPKDAKNVIDEIQKYSINRRWNLEAKLREKSCWKNISNLQKILDNYDEAEFKKLLPYLEDDNGVIRAWATEKLWNFIYHKEFYFSEAIPLLIKNLSYDDVFLRQITASILYAGVEEYPKLVFSAISPLSILLSDEADKVKHNAASTLSRFAELGFDITEAIPGLIKNITSKNHDVSYFSSLASRNYVRNRERAQYVLKQINTHKVKKKNKEIKRLIEVCDEFLV